LEIFASYPAYNTSLPNMNILTRYTALIGSPDPTLYYLGKSDKIPVYKKLYDKGLLIKDAKNYYKVRFTNETLPTVGDNGFAVRAKIFKKLIKQNKVFYHTDRFAEMIPQGYDTYAVTKNAIIHTTKPGIFDQVKRRVEVKEHFTDEMKGKREYLVYDSNSKKDRLSLFLYIFYSMTFIQPLALSLYGFWSKPDYAWFLHPIMCILMVFGYGYSELARIVKNILHKNYLIVFVGMYCIYTIFVYANYVS